MARVDFPVAMADGIPFEGEWVRWKRTDAQELLSGA